ncbi:copper chaperone PCu(A)C [Nonomuraea sp. NPDC059194]|uniref:copper chaperone PCu(A)C n=1 Tax=Nonomuraea sp. NPDC059194 TaxID=3346764 RepID=UPI00368DCA22
MTSRRWIIAAAAFLAAPVLAGCAAGFDANTNQPYAPNEAAALIENGSYGVRGVKIPQAFVLGPDSGAKLAQGGSAPIYLHIVNTNGEADSLVGVAAEGLGTVKLAAPIALPSNQGVNTGKPQPQLMIEGLSKPLSGGESVKLGLQFANAGSVTVTVPVVTRSREFAQYPAAPGATPAPPTPTPTETHTAESGH